MNLIQKTISENQAGIRVVIIEKIVGSYFTVMGLPIHKMYERLKLFNQQS